MVRIILKRRRNKTWNKIDPVIVFQCYSKFVTRSRAIIRGNSIILGCALVFVDAGFVVFGIQTAGFIKAKNRSQKVLLRMDRRFFKRILDVVCAPLALIVFCQQYAIIAILVHVKLGSPVLFRQGRPGMKDKNGHEKLFISNKFLTVGANKKRACLAVKKGEY